MVEFIETPFFTKALPNYLSDDEYCELQQFLNEHPQSGVVVPGSGGVRKLRWSFEGAGQTWRAARDLLLPPRRRRDLDDHDLQ